MREPGARWTEHDTSLAVALTLWDESLCTGCGQPLAESTSPHADPNHPDRTHWYSSPLPVVCHACKAVDVQVANYDEHPDAKALRFRAVKNIDTEED